MGQFTAMKLLLFPSSVIFTLYAVNRWEWAFYLVLFLFVTGAAYAIYQSTYNYFHRSNLL